MADRVGPHPDRIGESRFSQKDHIGKNAMTASPQDNFSNEFLKHYLKGGIGSMPKSDVDALVMHLLDQYAGEQGRPLGRVSNQIASERLRAPLAKIKRLRYEGCLKFSGSPENEGRDRFLRQIAKAGLEFDGDSSGTPFKVVFVIEDTLAKNWIQGKIKENGSIFDGSFNSEIIKIDPNVFFPLLRTLFPADEVDSFEKKFEAVQKKAKREEIVSGFKAIVSSFVDGVVGAAGTAAATALLALPNMTM